MFKTLFIAAGIHKDIADPLAWVANIGTAVFAISVIVKAFV